MKKYLLVIASTIAAAVSMNASAVTSGTVNFTGSVINATCEVAAGSENQTVTLPQALTSDFTAASQRGSPFTSKPFQITLSGCSGAVPGTVALVFDATPAAGFTNVIENTGTATGIGLQIRDAGKVMAYTGAILDHTTTPVALANGNVVFDLVADYYSTAFPVTPGTVVATATFGIHYP